MRLRKPLFNDEGTNESSHEHVQHTIPTEPEILTKHEQKEPHEKYHEVYGPWLPSFLIQAAHEEYNDVVGEDCASSDGSKKVFAFPPN